VPQQLHNLQIKKNSEEAITVNEHNHTPSHTLYNSITQYRH
jgi:hypothetical protein